MRPALIALAWVDRLSHATLIVCMAVMVVAVSTQVFLRYVLNSSIDWADELSRLMFVWVVFLAMPHGVKHGIHLGLDLFRSNMPPRVQLMLDRIIRIVLFLFLTMAGWQASLMTVRNWGNLMVTMDVSAGLFYLAIALGSFHALPHLMRDGPLQSTSLEGGVQ